MKLNIRRGQKRKDLASHVMEFELNHEENRNPRKNFKQESVW